MLGYMLMLYIVAFIKHASGWRVSRDHRHPNKKGCKVHLCNIFRPCSAPFRQKIWSGTQGSFVLRFAPRHFLCYIPLFTLDTRTHVSCVRELVVLKSEHLFWVILLFPSFSRPYNLTAFAITPQELTQSFDLPLDPCHSFWLSFALYFLFPFIISSNWQNSCFTSHLL